MGRRQVKCAPFTVPSPLVVVAVSSPSRHRRAVVTSSPPRRRRRRSVLPPSRSRRRRPAVHVGAPAASPAGIPAVSVHGIPHLVRRGFTRYPHLSPRLAHPSSPYPHPAWVRSEDPNQEAPAASACSLVRAPIGPALCEGLVQRGQGWAAGL